MKTLKWQQYLEEQLVQGKKLFTVAELANVAATSHHALNVELERLTKRGVLAKYARGVYGAPNKAAPADLVRYLDAHAYITSDYALFHHGMITQVPKTFTCFTDRRHNRSRLRKTSLGRFVFVTVKKPIYAPPAGALIAPGEQALYDFVYLMRRQGVNPKNVVTFRNLNNLRQQSKDYALHYPTSVKKDVTDLLKPAKE
ncbi:MAG: hypothetical protein ABIK20_01360 [Candidatus Omnitrophota bacterium]